MKLSPRFRSPVVVCALFAGLIPTNSTHSAEAKDDATRVMRNIVYASPDGIPQKLDLYLPKNASKPLPVVMWVHGGGWKNGSKKNCPGVWLTQHGYAVASIDYRLTDVGQWPAQIDDCRAAVRFLREHADEYHLDGSRIAAWGGSAGGHLVAVLGTLDAPDDEKTSSRVQAVIDWYGPTDLLTMPPNTPGPGKTEEDLANSNGAKLLGGTVRDLPKLAKQASAFYNVSKDDPPFLIMHGAKDPGVPLSQSQRLHDKLRAAGVPSKLVILPGAGHGGKQFRTPEMQEVIRKFLDEKLK
jgi:acetyl esterase/lipase